MSTTTNLLLTKLDATDKLKDFRLPYNANMEAIDAAVAARLAKIVNSEYDAVLTYTSDWDAVALGFYGFNLWMNTTGTPGTGIPPVKGLGLLMHVQLSSNNYAQIALGDKFYAMRNRTATTESWGAWTVCAQNDSATSTVSKATGIGGTLDMNQCQRVGNVVNLGARIYDASQTANGVFFVIPEGYRPRTAARGFAYLTLNNGNTVNVLAYINTNGEVSINYSSSAIAAQVGFSASYGV